MEYTVDYFIEKFSDIPEGKWCVGAFADHSGCKHCAYGHCGRTSSYETTRESDALGDLLNHSVADINDGNSDYLQDTPKQRILAALYDIKNSNR